jgi:hypothetical protein
MIYTSFANDIKKGKVGEQIFKDDFLEHLNIKYKDVTGNQAFQVIDTDYLASIGNKIEVKANYRDDNKLYIEDYSHWEPDNYELRNGWLIESKADLLVFISKKTRTHILLPNTPKFKKHYADVVKKSTSIIPNKISRNYRGESWQSWFRVVPFDLLKGFISIYKKL